MRSGVYPMLVSDGLFAVMVDAIAKLSLQRGTFVTLRDVVSQALDYGLPSDCTVVDQMKRMAPLCGQTRIYLRLYNQQLPQVEAFKSSFAEQIHKELNTREMVCICALLILQKLG